MQVIDAILEAIAWLFLAYPEIRWLLAHIAVNVIVALAVSIYTAEFCLGKTGEFLYRKVLPYTLIYAAFAIFGDALDMRGIAVAAFIGIETFLWSDLLDNLQKVGLKIPDALTKSQRRL
jgi:hypothetical protein